MALAREGEAPAWEAALVGALRAGPGGRVEWVEGGLARAAEAIAHLEGEALLDAVDAVVELAGLLEREARAPGAAAALLELLEAPELAGRVRAATRPPAAPPAIPTTTTGATLTLRGPRRV